MQFAESFKEVILNINEENFESYCLEVFNYQHKECTIYRTYCNYLKINPRDIKKLNQIPFLPIEFFKNHAIKSGDWEEKKIFKSSGTTKTGRSFHYIKELDFYHRMAKRNFEDRYGKLSGFQFLALLPSYMEAGDSSLIEMIDSFMVNGDSNYYLDKPSELTSKLKSNEKKILIGVSYALLEFSKIASFEPQNTIIMETGGMKGRGKELTREDLHQKLADALNVKEIHSEYGMTELMTQAYGKNGKFQFPNWAKVLIRDINDPFCYLSDRQTGGINVIDLANIDSCSFVETKDLGKTEKTVFEVLGRFDNSDIRGCNLMV